MSQEEHNDWPTFESVFHKIAPETLTARERLSKQAEQNTLDEAQIEAALEPLPVAVDPIGIEAIDHEEYESVDHATSDAIITAFEPVVEVEVEVEVEADEIEVFELATPDTPHLDEPALDEPALVPPVSQDSYEDDDSGWVTHAYTDMVVTEPTVESTAPVETQIEQPPVATPSSMDFSALFEPIEEPLNPIALSEPEYIDPELEWISPEELVEAPPVIETAPIVAQEVPAAPPAPVIEQPQPGFIDVKDQPSEPTEDFDQLRPKEDSGKITFWEGRPKFFGGDERRKARARRDSRFARDNTPAPQNVYPGNAYPAELPQDLPCPSCEHRNTADIRDPQDGTLHIRCDLCAHIWSLPAR